PDTVFRGFTSPITGPANTAGLAAFGNGPSPAPYRAARACDELTVSGFSDWYLPSKDEFNGLQDIRRTDDGFGFSGNSYWSSTETGSSTANSFSNVGTNNDQKSDTRLIRCVRRGG
ncbi:MAG: DUF1566 domain-containing protein, partial [Alphaproteobacteria bacterium]|nr:DUF1566 domain-containing protein [Alphaproteobacteria bacterium]